MLKTFAFIAIGGAFGAVMRFLSQAMVHEMFGREFPYGTLFVNVVGSLLIGVASVILIEKFELSSAWHMAIIVGVLGSFTTFSTFSIETLALFEQGDMFKAFANILLSVSLCISAVWAGVWVTKQII